MRVSNQSLKQWIGNFYLSVYFQCSMNRGARSSVCNGFYIERKKKQHVLSELRTMKAFQKREEKSSLFATSLLADLYCTSIIEAKLSDVYEFSQVDLCVLSCSQCKIKL